MRLLKIISLILIVLLLLCCKKKSTKSDDGLPHYWPRYTDMQPTWLPDGETIAYVHGGLDDTAGIYLINVDGTNKRLFYEGAKVYAPDFSPDGNCLVFSDYAQIFKIKLNGDSLTQLTFGGRNFYPDWSPDGKRIAFDIGIGDSAGVWVMDMNGNNKKWLIYGLRYPGWSPDGSKIVCSNYDVIWTIDSTGIVLDKFNFEGDNRDPIFSPDGQKIAFSTAHNSAPVIYVMDSDGKNLKMLTPEGGDNPAWSPDGKYIAYTYVHPDYGRIFIMNADGTGKRQLTFDGW